MALKVKRNQLAFSKKSQWGAADRHANAITDHGAANRTPGLFKKTGGV